MKTKKIRASKKLRSVAAFALILVMCACGGATAFAYNYDFSSGGNPQAPFGDSTRYDVPTVTDPLTTNQQRNKDAAYNAPPYFYGSGNIPTDPSNPYFDNTQGGGSAGTANGSGGATGGSGTTSGIPSANDLGTGISSPPSANGVANVGIGTAGASSTANGTGSGATVQITDLPQSIGFQSATSALITAPAYYEDGSIGTLYVERTGKTIKVYEGEDLTNLKKGAGHFTSTSAWDGNSAFCGHNRGSWPFFQFVKDMQTGDKVTYTTPYGVRTYAVTAKQQIEEHDYSKLAWSAENTLVLITCVENVSENRWAVTLNEVLSQ